jgi:hypothetical protein
VKASCCVNFSQEKQETAATDTVKLWKNFAKALKERDQDD